MIDDDAFWRDVAQRTLSGSEFAVTTAVDGIDGMVVLEAGAFDLVILDVDMPMIGGLSVLEQIRAKEEWKALPVIMLTGESRKDQVLRARDLGAVSYVLKARFSTEALLSRVRAALGGEGDANKSKAG